MEESIRQLKPEQKTGHEPFCSDGIARDFNLLDYWRWMASDLVSNTSRGILAEYIVARAVGVSTTSVRDDWATYDLETDGGTKIEVKSAAYIQSWKQARLSPISFRINKTRAWKPEIGRYVGKRKRHADIYVFALLHHKDPDTLNPLDLDQWTFYVLSTEELGRRKGGQASLSLSVLEKLAAPVSFDELRDAVCAAREKGSP